MVLAADYRRVWLVHAPFPKPYTKLHSLTEVLFVDASATGFAGRIEGATLRHVR